VKVGAATLSKKGV